LAVDSRPFGFDLLGVSHVQGGALANPNDGPNADHGVVTDDIDAVVHEARTSGATRRNILDSTTSRSARRGRVVSIAALVATRVALTGERRILGLELAAGKDAGSA
jgi:hypothetical protein